MIISVSAIYRKVSESAASAPLSELFPLALQIANELDNPQFKKWVELEYNGYFHTNPALTNDVVVPAYRTVAGQHFDIHGRQFVLRDPKFHFVNETRLRNGVVELEQLRRNGNMLTLQDESINNIIRDNLNVEVTSFSFSSIEITGILTSIRAELIRWLAEIKRDVEIAQTKNGGKKSMRKLVIQAVVAIVILVATSITYYMNKHSKKAGEKSDIDVHINTGKELKQETTQGINVGGNITGPVTLTTINQLSDIKKVEIPRQQQIKAVTDDRLGVADSLITLISEYKQQFKDINLCVGEDSQADLPRYRLAKGLIAKINFKAKALNSKSDIEWVNELTCGHTQVIGGIEIIKPKPDK